MRPKDGCAAPADRKSDLEAEGEAAGERPP